MYGIFNGSLVGKRQQKTLIGVLNRGAESCGIYRFDVAAVFLFFHPNFPACQWVILP